VGVKKLIVAVASKLAPVAKALKFVGKRVPLPKWAVFRGTVLKVTGIRDRGMYGFFALTVMVVMPLVESIREGGFHGGVLYLYNRVGGAFSDFVAAVSQLPTASEFQLYRWGVEWQYGRVLASAVLSLLTILWVYRLVDFLWTLAWGRDESKVKKIVAFLAFVVPMVTLYSYYEGGTGLMASFEVMKDGVSTVADRGLGVFSDPVSEGVNESVNQTVNGSVNVTAD